ncbi:uncharacterized protein J3D65DRAFT_656933 [Phyllosticta citribraziliensis]|uniref:Peptidase M43 pregnancy-associated plasma-A domain-containing protein n=1 Tax=Phyllosticta citribraziliensis TaxID=989973 RepID=A0ABR1LVW5_9PEZI
MLSFPLILALLSPVFCAMIWCGATEMTEAALDTTYRVAMLQEAMNATKSPGVGVEQAVSSAALNERLDCLVFFHMLDDYSEEGIYQSTILDQFNILKTAYAPVGFDFHLGGIYYYDQPDWADGNDYADMTKKLRLGGYDVLNIYIKRVVDSRATGKIAGYSKYPNGRRGAWDDLMFYEDGVLIATFALPTKDYPGDIGEPNYNWGIVAVHEVGHWLGLWHIFEDGCDPDLKWGGDRIADTPPQEYYHGECHPEGSKIDTCPGYGFEPSLLDNIMDYMPDECRNSFTPLQMQRMWWIFRSVRKGVAPEGMPPDAFTPRVPTVAPNLPVSPDF